MTYTITMTEAEVKNIMAIAEAIDSTATEFISEMLKDNIIMDFGGIIIKVLNHNTYEFEMTPDFSDFLLAGPVMDLASMSKVFKNIFGKLFNGFNDYFRSPITTYLDDDGNIIKVEDSNIIDDLEHTAYDDNDEEVEDTEFSTEEPPANEEPAPSKKPHHEFAIFNV